MSKCECKNKEILEEKLKDLETRYEQSKAASAYLQGPVSYTHLTLPTNREV